MDSFETMGHLPTGLAQSVSHLASLLSLPVDQLRLVLCLFLAIPLGALHQHVPTVNMRHIYSTVLGLLSCYFVVGYGTFYMWTHALVVYVLTYTLPRNRAPIVVFILSVTLLSASHIYRMMIDWMGYKFDVTLIQMVYVVKSVTFAYNWADGQVLNAGERLHTNDKVHQFRESRALRSYPSLLEYHSYVFFFGGVLVGPCFEMKEYLDFNDRTMFKKADLKSIPSTLFPTLNVLMYTTVCYAGVVLSGKYPVSGVLGSTEFASWDVLTRFVYFWVSITVSRSRYYFAWYLGEAACVASGFGYSGTTRTSSGQLVHQWERSTNCHAFKVETAWSMPEITNNWNMGVNNWLKHYVYFRVEAPHFIKRFIPSKTFTNIVTKFTAAAWHGFYGGYYLLFLGAVFVNEMDDAYRNAFEWRVTRYDEQGKVIGFKYPGKYIYRFVGWFLNMGCINYLGAAFLLLEISTSLNLWYSLYFFGTIMPIILMFVFRSFRKPRVKKPVTVDANGDKMAPAREVMEMNSTPKQHVDKQSLKAA